MAYKAYLETSKIEIFPTSIARDQFPYARVLTEDHILDMIRNVAPADSYVITETFSEDQPLEFIIHGYYVKLNATSANKHSFDGNDVYAHIFIDTSSPTHPQLYGTDDKSTSTFTGVKFSATVTVDVPTGLEHYEHYLLHLLELDKSSGDFRIPMASNKCIDGGEID